MYKTQILKLKQLNFTVEEIGELEVITGIEYITQHEIKTMLYQAEVLMSNGTDVFNKKAGLQRYKDFFDSCARYGSKHLIVPESERKIIDPTPNFLKG